MARIVIDIHQVSSYFILSYMLMDVSWLKHNLELSVKCVYDTTPELKGTHFNFKKNALIFQRLHLKFCGKQQRSI